MKIYYTDKAGGEWIEYRYGEGADLPGEIAKVQSILSNYIRWEGEGENTRIRLDAGTFAYSILFPNDTRFDPFTGWSEVPGTYARREKEDEDKKKEEDSQPWNLDPGQVWHDKDHKWDDGAVNLVGFYILLSKDLDYANPKDRTRYWETAIFFRCSDSFMGARIRKFTEEEIRVMYYVDNLDAIVGDIE